MESDRVLFSQMRQTSGGSNDKSWDRIDFSMSAENIIHKLTPHCSSAVFTRLRREGVVSASDLAALDKDDLRLLGLSMVERSRVMRWACGDIKLESNAGRPSHQVASPQLRPQPADPGSPHLGWQRLRLDNGADAALPESMGNQEHVQRHLDERRLDEVEQQADFWIDLVASAPSSSKLRNSNGEDLRDVRENMLEMLFDLTEEHVKEVYHGIDRDADGHISAAELRRGLLRYNLPELSDAALGRVLDVVTAKKSRFLQLPEFEAVLSRLKLAQVLLGAECLPSFGPAKRMFYVDYSNTAGGAANSTSVDKAREFFFGHRPQNPSGGTMVRWVHLDGLELTHVLALTVKYSLHPLSVEDVLEQSPTKIDRNGRNYFVAIEHLALSGASDGSEPVRVRGRHVVAFCAGPPRLDTIITISQPDKSFEEEWPGGVSYFDALETGDRWVERLQERLKAPLSRLREKQADFLLYQVIDLCTDELVTVTRTYTKRLGKLEVELHEQGSNLPDDWPAEVSLSRLQLAVLARRVRGLQRVIRHILQDPDLSSGLLSYFQDVADHLNEAHDDALQIADRCTAIAETYERSLERGQERVQQLTAERLNRTLFVLTVFTSIFAPLQFMAGVYGMNFMDPDSDKAGIPELVTKNGYSYFWIGTGIYLVFGTIFAWCCFKRLQRNEAKAKGACHAPLYLCGGGRASDGVRSGSPQNSPTHSAKPKSASMCTVM